MNDSSSRISQLARGLWRNTSALVALVLIVCAFLLGLRFGGGDPENRDHDRGAPAASPALAGESTLYTCSMHPTVRLPDPDAKCPICFMDLIPIGDEAGPGPPNELRMTPEALALAEIQTAPVRRRFPEGEVRLVGRVDFDETRERAVAAHFPGRLETLFVDYEGLRVAKGDHVAEIYSPELVAAQEELRSARAALDASAGQEGTLALLTEATYEAAREKLRLWGLDDAQVEELEGAEASSERITVHAPASGVVVERLATEGQYVETGTLLFRLADLERLWVRLEAFESQLPWLRFGQEVTFATEAYPGEEFHGTLSYIEPYLDETTRTVSVRLNVNNRDGRLKPGMFVRTRVKARVSADGRVVQPELAGKWISPMHPEIVKDAPGPCDVCGMPLVRAEELGYETSTAKVSAPLVIPATAPLITGERAVVYVRLPDRDQPTFEGREIVLGPRVEDVYVVREGLKEGEEVVVHGAFKIDSAMQIAARPSMMDPGKEAPGTGTDAHADHRHGVAGAAWITPVFEGYIAAQEALAADDLERFRAAAAAMLALIEGTDEPELSGEGLGRWRRAARVLREEAARAEDLSMDDARASFEDWSKALIGLAEHVGLPESERVVRVHCPMAFDFRGADWIQSEGPVANPFFGASMLRCGTVEETYAGESR